ncbi:MAG: hypothetical protein SFW66_01955 [Gammaproteobacteria bacterium]|nr:hypothetical protein [Gammaproteobacteria bacterium]
MSFSRPSGSAVALGLAADPLALPVIVTAAGVALTVAAAQFVYHEYKAYEEAKYKKQIDDVNMLHQKYLAKIMIPNEAEIQGFPAIFRWGVGDKANTVESMHLTDDQVKEIGQSTRRCDDVALAVYRQHILSAILKLQEYYFIQKNKDSVTSGVICYLLHMLEEKCLNFQGYDYDIAYLTALIHFINGYASLKHTKKTQHFSRFNAVYRYLLTAKQSLEKHKELLSLEEMLFQLKDFCLFQSDKLLRDFVSMVSEDDNLEFAETVTIEELANGILREEYIRSAYSGIVLERDHQIDVPDSLYKDWIKSLSQYYLASINVDAKINERNIQLSTDMFEEKADVRNNFWESNKKFQQIKKVHNLFLKCHNFISSKIVEGKLVPVSDGGEIIERSKILYHFVLLIHQMISLQYLSMRLIRSIKQLGEVYVKNPNHFREIFLALSVLCQTIKLNAEKCKENFMAIQVNNGNAMQLDTFQSLPEKIKSRLDTVILRIDNLEEDISDYRENATKDMKASHEEVESMKHEMFETVRFIEKMYQLEVNVPEEKEAEVLENSHLVLS